ncbi:MAG: 3-phosphoshikimate 1-carboxyvinyltransferase [Arenimonas sp.]|nr:3-phosphoshikimate 1-carboxyvinyltransferase [Arenimonas sp.]MBP7917567.1 3-phosphoshikimate 1-carboxyvinyltransferase [Arenimonas sp.]
MSLDWQGRRSGGMTGQGTVPGDKSISHRAIMLAALADGESVIEGFLEGEDTRATARIFSQLGVRIETPNPYSRIVHGVGLHGLRASAEALDCGNAGTGMRLLTGLLCAQAFDSLLVGDTSLSKRPMARVIRLLEKMGAEISARDGDFAPLRIHGGQALRGVEIDTQVASAQVKSALIFAALYAEGETVITEPRPTRDYTESMLKSLGWPIEYRPGEVLVRGGGSLKAGNIRIPGDISSAAFLIAAALLIPDSDITLRNIGVNPRRTGILSAFGLMGGRIELLNGRRQSGEPVADIRVRSSALQGIDLPEHLVPDMIDECPIFFVVAALAQGRTRATGLAELRVKESDRIASMVKGLRAMGADVVESPDSVEISGGRLHAADIDSFEDHRIAMSFAVAAQCADGVTRIHDCANVATSFPGFVELAQSLGMNLE